MRLQFLIGPQRLTLPCPTAVDGLLSPRENTMATKIKIEINGSPVSSLDDVLGKIIADIESTHGSKLALLPRSVQASIAQDLDNMGFLSMRNAVNTYAKKCNVTRTCVYNWIKGERRSQLRRQEIS